MHENIRHLKTQKPKNKYIQYDWTIIQAHKHHTKYDNHTQQHIVPTSYKIPTDILQQTYTKRLHESTKEFMGAFQ